LNQPSVIVSNPLAIGSDRLAQLAAFQRSSPTMARGDNLLYGGDFEDLGQMTQLGWQHLRHEINGVNSRAELSTVEPRHGSSCLLLQNTQVPGGNVSHPGEISVWIKSPVVPIADPTWLEITGWVRVEGASANAEDGLQIVDSLGGPDLAIVVGGTPGWQRFQMIRAAAESTELHLSFALAGIGTARVDAVMIRPLKPGVNSQPPVAGGAPQLRAVPVTTGPMLVAPQQ
jgi:hypothetical protein